MKVFEIIDGEKCYWRENGKFGYWSGFPKGSWEKENFFFLKAILLFLLMKMTGFNVKLERVRCGE